MSFCLVISTSFLCELYSQYGIILNHDNDPKDFFVYAYCRFAVKFFRINPQCFMLLVSFVLRTEKSYDVTVSLLVSSYSLYSSTYFQTKILNHLKFKSQHFINFLGGKHFLLQKINEKSNKSKVKRTFTVVWELQNIREGEIFNHAQQKKNSDWVNKYDELNGCLDNFTLSSTIFRYPLIIRQLLSLRNSISLTGVSNVE